MMSFGKRNRAAHGEQGCSPNRESMFHPIHVVPQSMQALHLVLLRDWRKVHGFMRTGEPNTEYSIKFADVVEPVARLRF
jgi:hypothetical protein